MLMLLSLLPKIAAVFEGHDLMEMVRLCHTKDHHECKLIREKVRSRLRNHRQSVSPLIVYITLWSDDFEPNNVIKHKRKSWLKSITIAPPNHSKVSH